VPDKDKKPHDSQGSKPSTAEKPHDLRQYFLVAQYDGTSTNVPLTKQAKALGVKTTPVYNVDLYLLDVGGKVVYHTKAHSGGWGLGPLPGLDADIDGDVNNKQNASYRVFNRYSDINITDMGNSGYHFENASKVTHKIKGKPAVTEIVGENKGYMIRLASPDYVSRGLQFEEMLNPKNQGAFGIHPDGKAQGSVRRKGIAVSSLTTGEFDGTQGCIGIKPKESEKLVNIINSLSSVQRPEQMVVLGQEDKLSDFKKYVKDLNANIVALQLRGSDEMLEMLKSASKMMQAPADNTRVAPKHILKPLVTPEIKSNDKPEKAMDIAFLR
jgi:hypothetical protein